MKLFYIILLFSISKTYALTIITPTSNSGYINGRSSTKISTSEVNLGSNGEARFGIFAPLIGFNFSLNNSQINIQSINLEVKIDGYGSGYNFGLPITASVLYNNAVSDDFSEISIPGGAFNEEISWFTDRGWIDTNSNLTFPTDPITPIGDSLTVDVTNSLSNVINLNGNNEFVLLILADNYVGSSLRLGDELTDNQSKIIIEYSVVPEPSSYALIFGCLALASASLSRRKR